MRASLLLPVVVIFAACPDKAPEPPPGYPRTEAELVVAYLDANARQDWERAQQYLRYVDAQAQKRELDRGVPSLPNVAAHIERRVLGTDPQPAMTYVSVEETRPDPSMLARMQMELMKERGAANDDMAAAIALLAEASQRFVTEVEAGRVPKRTTTRSYRVIKEDGLFKVVTYFAELERLVDLEREIATLRERGEDDKVAAKKRELDAVRALVPSEL